MYKKYVYTKQEIAKLSIVEKMSTVMSKRKAIEALHKANVQFNDASKGLWSLFKWSESSQGHKFWSNIAHKLDDM